MEGDGEVCAREQGPSFLVDFHEARWGGWWNATQQPRSMRSYGHNSRLGTEYLYLSPVGMFVQYVPYRCAAHCTAHESFSATYLRLEGIQWKLLGEHTLRSRS